MLNVKFGNYIKRRRQRLGMKQSTLAYHLQASQSKVSRIENGKVEANLYELYKLTIALNFSIDAFFKNYNSKENHRD